MKKLTSLSLIIGIGLLAACGSESVEAQGGRGGRGGGMGGGRGMGPNMQQGPIGLLAMPEVRRELNIDADAAKELTELVDEVMGEITDTTRSMMQEMRDGDRNARQEAMQKVAEQVRKLGDEAMEDVRKLLSEDQIKRLQELHLQRLGWLALDDADVQKSLGLTDSQVEQIKELQEQIAEERREMMQEMRGGRDEGVGRGGNREAMAEMQNRFTEMEEKGFNKILTEAQLEKMQKMQGEKFEFPQRRRGGRGGEGRRADF